MKKKFVWLIKAFVAFLVAFSIMTGFCAFYYNLPVHLTSQSKATDYYWEKNTTSIRATEGFAKVSVDDNGYVNTYPQKSEKIDVLVMGSSHTEGFNVAEDENYVYLLNQKFASSDNDMYVYNIGTSGHTLERCLRNLESAVSEFAPEKYVVIETTNVSPSFVELEALQNGELEYLSSYDSGFIYYLQKSDLFRILFSQFSNVLENENLPKIKIKKEMSAKSDVEESRDDYLKEYEISLENVLEKSNLIARKNNVELIFAYVPHLEIDYNGAVVEKELAEETKIFLKLCQKYDIVFLDMTDAFTDYYNKENCLLQGFSNTGVGVGHINKYGHFVIAEELYECITEASEK